jgi:hypothetical protein
MKNLIVKIILIVRAIAALIRKERKSPVEVGLMRSLGLWVQGFLRESYVIYDFDHNDRRDYLNDYVRLARIPICLRRKDSYLDNKLLFSAMARANVRVTLDYALIMNGSLIPLSNDPSIGDFESFERFCEKRSRFVLKPTDGGGGENVVIVENRGDHYLANGKRASSAELKMLVKNSKHGLLSDYVQQADYAKTIFPDTLNTVRMVTMIDPVNEEAFIATAIHRFGRKSSFPVDNWTNGGLSVSIDLETGVLGRAASYPRSGKLEWFDHHPDSGAAITGQQIPGWADIKREILSFAEKVKFLLYIGWDIAVVNDGFVIIEGNSNTDVNLLQLHGPLLRNQRVRDFYRHYKVI